MSTKTVVVKACSTSSERIFRSLSTKSSLPVRGFGHLLGPRIKGAAILKSAGASAVTLILTFTLHLNDLAAALHYLRRIRQYLHVCYFRMLASHTAGDEARAGLCGGRIRCTRIPACVVAPLHRGLLVARAVSPCIRVAAGSLPGDVASVALIIAAVSVIDANYGYSIVRVGVLDQRLFAVAIDA